MSRDYDNTNSGAIFANDRRQNDRQPTHRGEMMVECPECGTKTEFWISAWVKKAKTSGKKFFSLAFTAKEEQSADSTHTPDDEFDDDIPF